MNEKDRSLWEGPNILRYDVPYPFGPFVMDTRKQMGSNFVFPFVFSYLAVPDRDGKFQEDLAEKWTYNDQNFTWIFHLRQNVRFHNGNPLTSKDAAYSFQLFFKSAALNYLAPMIRKIETPTDNLLIVKLSQNDPQFLEKIWDIEILPEPEISNPPSENLIGSGPFILKQRNSQSIVLEANGDYFRGRPALSKIIFFYEPDKEKTWTRLIAGQTDVALEIAQENVPITQACKERFYMDYYTLPYYSIILYNTRDPIFSDIRVRRALGYAVDRDYIVKKILKGNGKIAAGPMGVESPYRDPRIRPLIYDPAGALHLLEQAGWKYGKNGRYLFKDGKPFEFTLYASQESPIHERLTRHLQLCFNDIGIKAYVKLMPMKDLIHAYVSNKDFQAVLTEAESMHRGFEHLEKFWASTDSECSLAGCFDDERVNNLFRDLSAENDPEVQKRLLHAIDARIAYLQPGAFLYHETVCDVMSRRFTLRDPFYLYPNRGWQLQFATLQKKKASKRM